MAEDPAKYSQESRSGSVDERDEPGQHHYPGFVGRRLFADRRGRRSECTLRLQNYIRQIEPQSEKLVKLYRGNVPIFDNFDISKQIKSLFAKYVSLRRGAYLIIEHTEAMNVIDVNSGNRTKAEDDQEQTAFDVNLAAAREIARSVRLRDLGGIVIIDFIDMHKGCEPSVAL